MKFSRKMFLKIISKVTRNQGFTLSLENPFSQKPQGGGVKLTHPVVWGLSVCVLTLLPELSTFPSYVAISLVEVEIKFFKLSRALMLMIWSKCHVADKSGSKSWYVCTWLILVSVGLLQIHFIEGSYRVMDITSLQYFTSLASFVTISIVIVEI